MKKIQKKLDLKRTTVTKLNHIERNQIVGGSDYWLECVINETLGATAGTIAGTAGATATGTVTNGMANGGSGVLQSACGMPCPGAVNPGSGSNYFPGGNNIFGPNPYGNSNPCCETFECK